VSYHQSSTEAVAAVFLKMQLIFGGARNRRRRAGNSESEEKEGAEK
jgi:hypothetical protein